MKQTVATIWKDVAPHVRPALAVVTRDPVLPTCSRACCAIPRSSTHGDLAKLRK